MQDAQPRTQPESGGHAALLYPRHFGHQRVPASSGGCDGASVVRESARVAAHPPSPLLPPPRTRFLFFSKVHEGAPSRIVSLTSSSVPANVFQIVQLPITCASFPTRGGRTRERGKGGRRQRKVKKDTTSHTAAGGKASARESLHVNQERKQESKRGEGEGVFSHVSTQTRTGTGTGTHASLTSSGAALGLAAIHRRGPSTPPAGPTPVRHRCHHHLGTEPRRPACPRRLRRRVKRCGPPRQTPAR